MQLPNYAQDWQMHLVETDEDVARFTDWLWQVDGPVSIDTETRGLRWKDYAFTRLFQVCDATTAWAIPTAWHGRLIHRALDRIRNAELEVRFWNAGFDMHALEDDGFPVPHWHNVTDGYILHHLLAPHRRHALKVVAAEQLGAWATVGQNQLKADMRAHGWSWETVPVDHPAYWQYGCLDTLITHRVVDELRVRVDEAGMADAAEREHQALAIMHRAETRGMRIDHRYAAQLRTEWTTEAVELGDLLRAEGIENPNSNRQVEQILRAQGWVPEDFTETGQALLDKTVLNVLSGSHPKIAEPLVRYKRLTKWIGSYLDPFAESGGRVHPGINTLRAKTGRMSITDPALQTLPSKGSAGAIRRCVLPEPGHELWAIDYDGQEARIFANLSHDPGMAAAYEAGDDLYTHVARIVWDDPSIGKSDSRRSTAKVILLAFTYGAGVDKLSLASGQPKAAVEQFLHKLFVEFPTVRDMTGDHAIGGSYPGKPALLAEDRGRTEGLAYVNTKGGRRFSMPEGETYKAINGLCQGSGADVLKAALVRLDRAGIADHIVVPVHDEVLFSIPKGEHGLAQEAAACMADHDWTIPLTVDVTGPLDNWGEAYGA